MSGISRSTVLGATNLAAITYLQEASDFRPAGQSAFRYIKKLRLYGAAANKFYSVRYFFRNDVGVRFNFTITRADDAAGTNPVDVAAFSSTGVEYAGQIEFSLAAVGGSGITGALVVDFTAAPASWAIYRGSSGATFSNLGVRPDVIETSGADDAYQDAKIATALAADAALSAGARAPFVDTMNTGVLRQLVRNIRVYGGDPDHEYIVSRFGTQQFGIPLTRALIEVTDVTTGTVVCSWRAQTSDVITVAAYVATLPGTIKLTDYLTAAKTKMYAVMEVDWSAATDAERTYTTTAQAGIHPSCIYTDEMIADALDRDQWHEVIRCGAGETYTTLRAAVEATYSPITGATTVNGAPLCEFAHYGNRVLIDIVDEGEFEATGLYLPDWVSVRGCGMDRTTIVRENLNADPLIEQHVTAKFFDCTLVSETAGEYCIHSDDFNRNSSGGTTQNVRLRQAFKRLRLQGAAGHNGWLFGCGISSGQVIEFEDVTGEHLDATATAPAFGFHNTGPTLSTPTLIASAKPAQVIMRGCASPDETAIELATLEQSAVCTLTLIDCDFNLIRVQTSSGNEVLSDLARERNAWRIGGVHRGPWVREDSVGEIVLKTTAGQVPAGDAAALIFGTVDELGQGEKWIKTGTSKSLGARLGDCSGVNKTLTIGAETHTFTTDLTAVDNATIIAAINLSIPTHPVSEKDVALQWAPDAIARRRMTNNTGATIAAGKFVKRTGAATIALAAGTDDVLGLVIRDILNGQTGEVITARRLHASYITGAGADGKFGLTAGALDYGAATKVGYVSNSIATLYA